MAGIAFWTSDAAIEPEARKALAVEATNPELCRITEDLALTEPYLDHEHNWRPRRSTRPSRSCAPIRGSDPGRPARHLFRTHGEARIHGDLHTGSVMVGGGRTVVIDPEFAFYRRRFDLGALWANAAIAALRAAGLGRPEPFRAHIASILPARGRRSGWSCPPVAPAARPFLDEGFREAGAGLWHDGLGFAGAKAIRRISASRTSATSRPSRSRRSVAATAVLRFARRFVLERAAIDGPTDLWTIVQDELGKSTAASR